MGRSVSYPSGAVVVFARADEIEDRYDFRDFVIEPFVERLREIFPSVEADDRWLDREDHVVASNRLAYFGVSEYCGLVSYWMVARDDLRDANGYEMGDSFGEAWVARVASRFTDEFGDLVKVGSFSNGEGVYRAKDGGPAGPDNLDGPIIINGYMAA